MERGSFPFFITPVALIVLPGQGDGTFETPLRMLTDNAPYTVTASDLVGDGTTKLVIAGIRRVFPLAGTGFFQALTSAGGGDYTPLADPYYISQIPNVIVPGALTLSGRIDVAVAGKLNSTYLSDSVEVYAGLGSGKLQLPADASVSRIPIAYGADTTVLSGDFNEDDKLNIIRVSGGSYSQAVIEFLPGTGSGTFGDPVVIDRVQSGLLELTGGNIVIGDFTGDGHLDVQILSTNTPPMINRTTASM